MGFHFKKAQFQISCMLWDLVKLSFSYYKGQEAAQGNTNRKDRLETKHSPQSHTSMSSLGTPRIVLSPLKAVFTAAKRAAKVNCHVLPFKQFFATKENKSD